MDRWIIRSKPRAMEAIIFKRLKFGQGQFSNDQVCASVIFQAKDALETYDTGLCRLDLLLPCGCSFGSWLEIFQIPVIVFGIISATGSSEINGYGMETRCTTWKLAA